jgi:hypothetical protein
MNFKNVATSPARISRRTILTALAMLAALGLLHGPEVRGEEPAKTVRLTIDYGDGSQRAFTRLAWKEDMTVFDLLQAAAKHPRGIKVTHQGKGATTLVTAIDGLENEGRGRNWIYEVNDKTADRGCGVWKLAAGDVVLWRFDTYR